MADGAGAGWSGIDGQARLVRGVDLKKGSFVFLASCDTNNVLSGEGLVSLAWEMTGAGATTVISAQWDADDKFTGLFTKSFYQHYKEVFHPRRHYDERLLK